MIMNAIVLTAKTISSLVSGKWWSVLPLANNGEVKIHHFFVYSKSYHISYDMTKNVIVINMI